MYSKSILACPFLCLTAAYLLAILSYFDLMTAKSASFINICAKMSMF